MPSQSDDKRQAAREVIDILHEISTLLVCEPSIPSHGVINTALDRTDLSLCVSLIENGVNPDALATIIKDLRKEATAAPQLTTNENDLGE
ncbi:mitotic-spindle organizing protein associated with a ring of gamma-tubulin 1 [Aspergillus bombycis]|uniref:Mitotic-spindle organizing protein 1 n=1 Tax=Aspergillus bombycis TaxID=109264 RepID=A0A1F7ZWF8_9EURO|nr:mitotic-spindle organizing protein associated with a ring of gamma-tubulin 1 [Aspergillus bombycis]OGM43774.1 mitotic-spindle organizing protein associated with a ring of gamma-tubulin 1 [Aspergillus bombycis]